MTHLDMITKRMIPPVPWDEGDNIPWNEPGFSERMLKEHLSQDHDLASRKTERIEHHVRWIFEEILGSRPGRVLDLACGPGLYASALAELGCECMGVDFSPASIRHAEETAATRKLSCSYRLADVRDGAFGDGFDLVMMIYGQINVFEREKARSILQGMAQAIVPGGTALLEPQTHDHIRGGTLPTTSWYTAPSGLFSADPHLVLQEGYWDEASSTRTERFFVIDPATGKTERYALSNVAYGEKELASMMSEVGLESIRAFPSLSGKVEDENATTQVLAGTARR
ncbi:MAG: class I SAM-dependent methyltransferase [Deltaproteobacteria bacterium]|nr:class I SAM-dependent methyltransferase [Deltaproteobacteria bacterium]